YKELEDYGQSILIRQLNQGKKLCATFNAEYALHSQSIYNLTIRTSPIPEFNHYYLLGLINSRLISYYFMKSFGSYKELFPRVLIEKINEIPIKIPKTESERECAVLIAQNIKKILNLNDKKKKNTLQEIIDKLVFKLYEISQEGENHILKTFLN
ncbi:MAG: TaqI-like C-terminal specificity domain-containing protein, partial [Promethearchaeota archaeon]